MSSLMIDIQTAMRQGASPAQRAELLRRVDVVVEEEIRWHPAYLSVFDGYWGGGDYHSHPPAGGKLTRLIGRSIPTPHE